MLIVIDKRAPKMAKEQLAKYGTVVEFITQNICYPAISGHPDIFLCQLPGQLICAPNLPKSYFTLFDLNSINYQIGKKPIQASFPNTTHYNCLATDDFLFHKPELTDTLIVELTKKQKAIALPQAYTRCSLFKIGSAYVTSDKGIENALKKEDLAVHYFQPDEILLPGLKHGFIGGALGIHNRQLFMLGNPKKHAWGTRFTALIQEQGFELISLYDGPFYDGGGLFFL